MLNVYGPLMNDLLRLGFEPAEHAGEFPAVDVFELADAYEVHADLPGVRASDLEVTFERDALKIRGARSAPNGAERQLKRRERGFGSFERTFVLPDDADGGEIRADMHDGVLVVRIQKKRRAVARRIEIGRA